MNGWKLVFHWPLPLAVISLVTFGAIFSPTLHIDRLVITWLLVFFGLLLVAYPLDAIYSDWSSKIDKNIKGYLWPIIALGLAGFFELSIYAISHTSLIGIIVALILMFFLVSYNMEKPKWIHNKWGFAVSWGGFSIIGSYFYQTVQLNWIMIPLFITGMLIAMIEWYITNTHSPIQEAITQLKNGLSGDAVTDGAFHGTWPTYRKIIRKETFFITSLLCYTLFFFSLTMLYWRLT